MNNEKEITINGRVYVLKEEDKTEPENAESVVDDGYHLPATGEWYWTVSFSTGKVIGQPWCDNAVDKARLAHGFIFRHKETTERRLAWEEAKSNIMRYRHEHGLAYVPVWDVRRRMNWVVTVDGDVGYVSGSFVPSKYNDIFYSTKEDAQKAYDACKSDYEVYLKGWII